MKKYLFLFEAILNSKLIKFYLNIKYLIRDEGTFTEINLDNIKKIPIPDLTNLELIELIINTTIEIHSFRNNVQSLQDRLDNLIYDLYNMDYYTIQQVEHYQKIEKEGNKYIDFVNLQQYCDEFVGVFNPFLKENLTMRCEMAISPFFGAMIEFIISKTKDVASQKFELNDFLLSIDKYKLTEFEKDNIFKEKNLKFYEDEKLYIYKSNKIKDWTKLKAINDANEEISMFFSKLR